MSLIKVKENPNLLKDSVSGAILNTNKKEAEEYRIKKTMMTVASDSMQEINNVMVKLQEVDELKKDIAEIKKMLKGLVK